MSLIKKCIKSTKNIKHSRSKIDGKKDQELSYNFDKRFQYNVSKNAQTYFKPIVAKSYYYQKFKQGQY